MAYVLEAEEEFDRLERQSQHPSFDYKHELRKLDVPKNGSILDAGCGSGIVCRYIAEQYSTAHVFGCDLSQQRASLAAKAAKTHKNISIAQQDITALTYDANQFDAVICRYVLQHLGEDARRKAATEFFRVLKPGGQIYFVDTDALITTLYPQTALVAETIEKMRRQTSVDLDAGRKLPTLLVQSRFEKIDWAVDVTECKGANAAAEIEMMQERFVHVKPFLTSLTGSQKLAEQFAQEYVSAMKKPGAVYYQNKFIVTGYKPSKTKLSLVK